MNEDEYLDIDTINRLEQELGKDLLLTLMKVFVEETISHIVLLKQALNDSQQSEVIRLTHSIKSGALTYGAARLANMSKFHEECARNNENSLISAQLAELDSVMKMTSQHISTYLQ